MGDRVVVGLAKEEDLRLLQAKNAEKRGMLITFNQISNEMDRLCFLPLTALSCSGVAP